MKNYLFGSSLFLASLITPSFAEESNDFYLKVGGGITFPSDIEMDETVSGTKYDGTFATDNTGIFSAGFGKAFNGYRLEFEYSKSQLESDEVTAKSGGVGVVASMTPALEADVSSFMIYGMREFNNDSKFTPYAGIGLGAANFDLDDQTITLAGTSTSIKGADESVFSYAVRAGADYEIADNTFIYSEATYQNLASFKSEEAGFTTINFDSSHLFNITAGVKFNF